MMPYLIDRDLSVSIDRFLAEEERRESCYDEFHPDDDEDYRGWEEIDD